MQPVSFNATTTAGPRGSVVVMVPFDPDEIWAAKPTHAVRGTMNSRFVRGKLERSARGWAFTLPAMWARDCDIGAGMAG